MRCMDQSYYYRGIVSLLTCLSTHIQAYSTSLSAVIIPPMKAYKGSCASLRKDMANIYACINCKFGKEFQNFMDLKKNYDKTHVSVNYLRNSGS